MWNYLSRKENLLIFSNTCKLWKGYVLQLSFKCEFIKNSIEDDCWSPSICAKQSCQRIICLCDNTCTVLISYVELKFAYWTKNYVTILTKAANWMTYYWGPCIQWLALTFATKISFKLMHWKRSNLNCDGNDYVAPVSMTSVTFYSFIGFSRKAHKTWLSAHIKQSKTLANFHHTRGNYTHPNTHKTKLSAT